MEFCFFQATSFCCFAFSLTLLEEEAEGAAAVTAEAADASTNSVVADEIEGIFSCNFFRTGARKKKEKEILG
jgi:hypothetical protein